MIISIQDWNPARQTLRPPSPDAHSMKGSALCWTSSGLAGGCLNHSCTGRDCYVLSVAYLDGCAWKCSPSGVVIVVPLHGATRYHSTGHSLNQRCGKLLLGLSDFPMKPNWEPPQFIHFVCPQNHVDTEVCSLQKLIWACLREQLAGKLISGGSPRQCICGKNPSVLEPKMGF